MIGIVPTAGSIFNQPVLEFAGSPRYSCRREGFVALANGSGPGRKR